MTVRFCASVSGRIRFSIMVVRGGHGLVGLDLFEQFIRGPNDFMELIGQITAPEVVAVHLAAFTYAGDLGQSLGNPIEFLRGRPLDAVLVRALTGRNETVIHMIQPLGPGRTIGRVEPGFTGKFCSFHNSLHDSLGSADRLI